jgi:hypothetical protein
LNISIEKNFNAIDSFLVNGNHERGLELHLPTDQRERERRERRLATLRRGEERSKRDKK